MSFKVKLALWLALLALLPLAVAFWGLNTLARQSETRRVDATLEAGLRAAVVGYGTQLDAATAEASRIASQRDLQLALRRHDRGALVAALRGYPLASATAPGISVGASRSPAGERTVAVVDHGKTLGRVTVWVPLGRQQLALLGAGLPPNDKLVAVRPGAAVVDDKRFRVLTSAPLRDPGNTIFVALAPQSAIDASVRSVEERLGLLMLAGLLAIGLAAYLFGSSIVATLRGLADAAEAIADGHLDRRVRVRGRDEFAQLSKAFNDMATQLQTRLDEVERERGRAREANTRFAAALAATHDPAELLRHVVESAVEATGATGGLVLRPDGELARVGNPDEAPQRIAFPLRLGSADFGSLVVAGYGFDSDQVEAGASLAARAVVALDNARLHRIVERQALFDGLTGLANRRSLEETLQSELARASRFGHSVCFVLADLDDFKDVNDTYGHPAGDDALRAFARTLARNVREVDVAGRWGGEEFALILPGTDLEGGALLAERVRAAFEERSLVLPDGREIGLTASFGVAATPGSGEPGELVAAADSALYEAKRTGKNRVMV